MKVRIVCYEDVHEWILGKFALKLQEHLRNFSIAADISKVPDPTADVNHHITYWGYERKSSPVETLMITHIDTDWKLEKLKSQLLTASMGICMSTDTVYKLIANGCPAEKLCFVNPAQDGIIRPRKTVIGITSRLYEDVRKREHLLVNLFDAISPEDFKFKIMGGGWKPVLEHIHSRGIEVDYYENFDYEIYRNLIENLDYYLYMGQDEGSMGFLDAVAAGVNTIVTPQGFHLDVPGGITYAFNEMHELEGIFADIADKKKALARKVVSWGWAEYTRKHLEIWQSLGNGVQIPYHLTVQHTDRNIQPDESDVSTQEKAKPLKVLITLHKPEQLTTGGPSVRVLKTRDHLRKLGIVVDVTTDDLPDPRGYDLVHVFNVWEPLPALAQLQHLKKFKIPIVFSPIYLDMSEYTWAAQIIPAVFASASSDAELDTFLQLLPEQSPPIGSINRYGNNEIYEGFFSHLRAMVGLADHLIALGEHEMSRLWASGIEPRPYTLVHNAADFDLFSGASKDAFVAAYGVSDYVLCVGRIEKRKNQLMLAHALSSTDLPLVFIGHTGDKAYTGMVQKFSRGKAIFIERLPHGDMLASAYKGARVFVLPSWCEGAPLSALEAAAAGTALVLSNRSSEREYFGDLASYCDPCDCASIRNAVVEAYHTHSLDSSRRQRLQELLKTRYTWENAAKDTLRAYHATITSFKGDSKTPLAPAQALTLPYHVPTPGEVYDVTACENDIDLTRLEVIHWAPVWMTRAERLMLYNLIYCFQPARYLEIGMFKGGSALIVAAAMDALATKGKMICIDPEPQIAPAHWQLIQHRTELVIGFSPEILPQAQDVAGGSFDFVLIDGDHTYPSVIRDAVGVMPFVKNGGHILFHDSYNTEVARAIDEFAVRFSAQLLDFGLITREVAVSKDIKSGGVSYWGGLRLFQKKSHENGAAATKPVSTDGSRRIRVMLDISVLGLSRLYESAKTGVFRVVENLAHGLASSPEIELSFCSTQHLTEHAPDTSRACQNYLAANPYLRHVPFHATDLPKVDIFHSPFHALPDSTLGLRRFLTVYDLIAVLYPEMFQGKVVNSLPRILASLNPDDRFICISHATKQDVCQHLGVIPDRAYVTHLAANPVFFYPCNDNQQINMIRSRYAIPLNAQYLLSLCTLEPRKNVDHVIRSFSRLVAKGVCPELMLVLVGTKGWNFEGVLREIESQPLLRSRIILTGFVPDCDLAALYSGALAFAYMSRYEGFGLPPLEAMQCGVPVITSNTSSLPEVVGDAGIMLDPDDQEGLCNAIEELYENQTLRRYLSIQSIKQSSRFSWDRCVKETIMAYKSACSAA